MLVNLCDRCGKQVNEPGKRFWLWLKPYMHKIETDEKAITLCPKCFDEFKKVFMKGSKLYGNDYDDDEMEVE